MRKAKPLRSIHLRNVLSYGRQGIDVQLWPLNVLIGANASGKSNLISVLHLDKGQLAEWLERYRLGDLWRMGEIGGNRW